MVATPVVKKCLDDGGGDGDGASLLTLHALSLVQFLSQDKRPAFIFDSQREPTDSDQSTPARFVNPALAERKSLLDCVNGHSTEASSVRKPAYHSFWRWTRGLDGDSSASDHHFAGWIWTCIILENRWRVFTTNVTPESEPWSQTSSPATSNVPAATNCKGEDPSHRPYRPKSQTSSATGKAPNPMAKPRSYFAAELPIYDKDGDVKTAQRPPDLENGDHLDASTSADLKSDALPEIRVARRHAKLLDQISAFETVGISITDKEGKIVFANDALYQICGISHGATDAAAWMNIFDEAEMPKIAEIFKRITIEQEAIQFQTPTKWRWAPPQSKINPSSIDFPVWISVWAYPDVSSQGETIGCCTVLTDITEQKWTEKLMEQQLIDAVERARVLQQLTKDLALTEARFRRLSDSMPHGIFTCDTVGNILYANDAYREMFPGTQDPTLSQPWWANVPEDELQRATEVWRRLLEDHVKVSFEMSFLKSPKALDASSNERRYLACSSYPELDEKGELKHITGSVTDISYLKIAEQTQGVRADYAEASKQELEHFIDMTSHEIRNPLSAIVHSAEEILSSLRSPGELTTAVTRSMTEAVITILECTSHSTRIVDDILTVSKLESGLLSIVPKAVQLTEAIRQCVKMFDGEMRAADIIQSVEVDGSFEKLDLDWVYLDISRVLQILINLITNAIKFTRPEKLRRINIRVSASLDRPINGINQHEPHYLEAQMKPQDISPEPSMVEHETVYIAISVKDSGCGLSETEQKNLFQRFSQAGKRTHIKYGGTGLGLFISRQLCEMQDGRIGVRSIPGKGSLFVFYVKASKSSPPRTHTSDDATAGLRFGGHKAPISLLQVVSPTVPQGSGTDFPVQQTVLLVEDNLVNQKVVAKMLRAKGFTVLVANHGAEALHLIRESALFSGALAAAFPISLILLDVEMPVMDGLTCIRHIRKMESLGELRVHVPVIATTANARLEQVEQAKEAGMDSVVTKPFRMDELLAVMKQLWKQYPI